MKIKDKIRQLAFNLETNTKAKAFQGLLQVSLAVSAGLYSFNIFPSLQGVLGWSFAVSAFLILVIWVVTIIFYRRYGVCYLIYNKNTGHLHDQNLKKYNIALRKDTVHKMLEFCPCEADGRRIDCLDADCLKEIGKVIGKDFLSKSRDDIVNAQGTFKSGTDGGERALLEYILEYDSTSGMGLFHLDKFPGSGNYFCEISIVNPFTNTLSPGGKSLHPFLSGYIEGIMEEVFGAEFECAASSGNKKGMPALMITAQKKR